MQTSQSRSKTFASFAIVAEGCIERSTAAQPAVHVNYVLVSNTQPFGDDLHQTEPPRRTSDVKKASASSAVDLERKAALAGMGVHRECAPADPIAARSGRLQADPHGAAADLGLALVNACTGGPGDLDRAESGLELVRE